MSETGATGPLSPSALPAGLEAATIAGRLHRLRERAPRVHTLTNSVAQALTANLLLAAGAIPSTTIAAEEIPFFTARADALLINLGTLDAERRAAIPIAIDAARQAGKPWLLDPVFAEASPPRLAFARELLAKGPAILRANDGEMRALTGAATPGALLAAARSGGLVLARTGTIDWVSDGARFVAIANGHRWMARVTAMGCAGTALIAALLAVEPDAFLATASALAALGVAGEIASTHARGPGTFPAAFLDALDALGEADLTARLRLSAEATP